MSKKYDLYLFFSTIHRANCCPSACQLGMDSALQYSSGARLALLDDMEHSPFFFLAHWQSSVHRLRHDDNVRTSFKVILDTFEFANEADVLRNIQPASRQATVLDEMLQCVSECANYIKAYAFTQVGTSS
jgi:hypothetical protein